MRVCVVDWLIYRGKLDKVDRKAEWDMVLPVITSSIWTIPLCMSGSSSFTLYTAWLLEIRFLPHWIANHHFFPQVSSRLRSEKTVCLCLLTWYLYIHWKVHIYMSYYAIPLPVCSLENTLCYFSQLLKKSKSLTLSTNQRSNSKIIL